MSDAFVPVAALVTSPPARPIDVAIGDLEIALVRDEDGGVHALEDLCSHDEIALSDGDVEGCTIDAGSTAASSTWSQVVHCSCGPSFPCGCSPCASTRAAARS